MEEIRGDTDEAALARMGEGICSLFCSKPYLKTYCVAFARGSSSDISLKWQLSAAKRLFM